MAKEKKSAKFGRNLRAPTNHLQTTRTLRNKRTKMVRAFKASKCSDEQLVMQFKGLFGKPVWDYLPTGAQDMIHSNTRMTKREMTRVTQRAVL